MNRLSIDKELSVHSVLQRPLFPQGLHTNCTRKWDNAILINKLEYD